MDTRIQEREYPCKFADCPLKFKTQATAKQHEATHTTERPFVCPAPDCGRAFKLYKTLKKHEKAVHLGQTSGASVSVHEGSEGGSEEDHHHSAQAEA